MKILMLAPEPFFQPRGTPISVFFRLKALSALGHSVDLVTYPLGQDRSFEGLRIFRIPNLFLFRRIKIGPSLAKIPLDALLSLRAAARLCRSRYDLIFSHEEAGFIGSVLGRIWRIPHLYDMHSSLPQQLDNFQFTRSRWIRALFTKMEAFVLRRSGGVIVICRDLWRQVSEAGWEDKAVLLENFIDFSPPESIEEITRGHLRRLDLEGRRIVLYAGNFLPYQGVPLLLEAAARIPEPDVAFLLVGGTPEAVERQRAEARRLGLMDRVRFTGQVPPSEVPAYISLAHVLVSPRLQGTNTPLKIYSWLKSGRPIVATNLWTHTQVLNEDIAILVDPDPASLADGIAFALEDEAAAERARRAKALADEKYTFDRYLELMSRVLETAASSRT